MHAWPVRFHALMHAVPPVQATVCCGCQTVFPESCAESVCASCAPKCELCRKRACHDCINECDKCAVVLCRSCLADGFECAACDWLACAACCDKSPALSDGESDLENNDSRQLRWHTLRCPRCQGLATTSADPGPDDGTTEPSGAPFPLAFDPSDPCERMRLRVMGLLAQERDCSEVWHRLAFSRFVEQARAPLDEDAALVHAETVPTAVHRSVLSEDEIAAVLAAAESLEAQYAPQTLRCQGGKIWYGACHATLYLHHDGWFARTLPELYERLVRVMRAQWLWWYARPADAQTTLRCQNCQQLVSSASQLPSSKLGAFSCGEQNGACWDVAHSSLPRSSRPIPLGTGACGSRRLKRSSSAASSCIRTRSAARSAGRGTVTAAREYQCRSCFRSRRSARVEVSSRGMRAGSRSNIVCGAGTPSCSTATACITCPRWFTRSQSHLSRRVPHCYDSVRNACLPNYNHDRLLTITFAYLQSRARRCSTAREGAS